MAKINRWFIPTNTENMKLIISQGLVATSDGFKKYYKDTLELFLGDIPLYKNSITQDVLNLAVSEIEGLTPCLIEIDLGQIVSGINDLEEIEDSSYLLIRAPLPITCIAKIIFKSVDEKANFENDAKIYSNVVLTGLKLQSSKVDQKLFSPGRSNGQVLDFDPKVGKQATDEAVNDPIPGMIAKKLDYQKVYAFGGVLANLFYFSKNGESSNAWFQKFSSFEISGDTHGSDDINLFGNYFFSKTGESNSLSNAKQKMYEGVIEVAIKNKDFGNDILAYLEGDFWDDKYKKRTQEIAGKLRDIAFAKDKPVSEHINEAKNPLEKILLMLFLREDSNALIDYKNPKVTFTEEEYLYLAFMFGIRNKFRKSPKFLREYADLQHFISNKMAEYAHQLIGSNVKFKQPKMPKSIYEYCFANNSARINERLLKELKIEDGTISTIMPAKEFTHKNGKNIYAGFCKPKYEIDREKYFDHISKMIITQEIYNKISSYMK